MTQQAMAHTFSLLWTADGMCLAASVPALISPKMVSRNVELELKSSPHTCPAVLFLRVLVTAMEVKL